MSYKRVTKTKSANRAKSSDIKSRENIKKILFKIPEDGMNTAQIKQWREIFRKKFKNNKNIYIPKSTLGYDVVDFIWNNPNGRDESIKLMVGWDGRIVIYRYAYGEIIDKTEREFKTLNTIIDKIRKFKPTWVISKNLNTQSFTLTEKQSETYAFAEERGATGFMTEHELARRIYLEGLAKKNKKLKIPQ